MKKLSIIFALLLFCVTLHSQQSKDYYYYQGKKVFLTEKSDKIFINLWKNADTESLFSLMQADKYLKLNGLNKNTLNTYLILEVKEGKFSSETLDQYRNNPAVKSAQFMLEYEHNILIGLLNEFTVKLKSATSFAQLQNLISKYVGCVIEREERFVKNQYVLSVNRLSEFNALQLANLFYETGLFEFSKPNFAVINTLCSNDPYFEDQWALLNSSFGGVDIKAEQAWNITQGSPLITIAVPDNGVDLYQPDLQSNLLSGYDVTDSNSDGAPVTDQDNHGTACAGIIGAIKDNDEGISGVAPGCRLIPIKMSCTYELYGNIFTVIKAEWAAYAIRLAYNVGADVISNSWGGGPPDDDVTNAINDAVAYGRNNRGCVIVFASGNKDPYSVNNDIVSYPACLPNVISVGASSPNGFRPLFSNYGIDLDVVAPGEYIYTTDRTGNAGYVGSSKTAEMNICFRDSVRSNITSRDLPDGSDYYCCFTGTSAACPHVAGIAALILSTNNSFSWLQVKEIIESSAQKVKEYNYIYSPIIGRPNGTWNNEMGYGLVDAHKAVVYAKVYGQPKSISGDSNLSICNTYSYTCNIAHQEIFTYQWSCSSNLLITTDVSSNTISITPVNENSGYVSVDIFNQGRLMFTLTKSVFVNNTALPPLTPIVGTSISTNTTWANNNYFLASSVAVERGATLTITSNVYCTSNVSITVQPGGKLVIDGGILQNACEEEMWQGITVLGDRRYTGLVQMKNGGTIQNAITGILVKDEGYVSTNNANFINNTTGVLFQNQDLSNSFTSTNFELNSSYFGATPFVAHIKAQNGGSITATVCTFSGTGSGYGIWASNTNLVVKEYCSDPSPSVGIICPENYVEPSAFSGLNYGIYHISGGILPTLKVRFSHFSNCMENIYIAGTNFAEVIKNDFDITRNMGRGMLVRYATGYKIEENTFRDSNHNPKKTTTGMLVQGSGSAENEVYKNEYKNLSIGQQFSEKNSSQTDIVPCPNCPQSKGIPPPPVTGVQTLCNQFENNYTKDIFISQSASIRKNQGSGTSPAGNRFLGSTPFNIDNALSQHSIEYNYRNPNNEYPPVVSNNVNRIITSSVNGCPSKIGSIIINPQNKGEGGIEQYLVQYDEWNTQYEYWLKKLLVTEPNSEEYLIILDQVSYYSALKDNYFNSIVVATMGEEEKGENSPSNIEGAKGEKGEGAKETLRYLFNYRNHYSDNLCIVETYLAENNFGEALITLAKMHEKFELPEEQLNELTGLQIYVLWLQQLEENGQNIYELSEYELNYLVRYVETNTGRGVVFARNILCELYGICLEGEGAKGRMDERAKGEEEKGEGENLRQSAESALSACHKITLVPNPTNGELIINNEQLTINNIEIFDIYGKKHHLITSSSNHLINIVSLPAGIYFIKISTEVGDVVRKIVKQ